jgi:uncharacterized membrane protein
MNLIILSASYFLHFFATVVWIGGIIMILLVILPSAKTSLEAAPMISGLMKEITKHFTPMANISIFILIVTGIVIAIYNKNFTNILDFSNHWNLVMFLKHIFVALMIIIHFYRGLILNPKIGKLSLQVDDSQIAKLRKYSLDLVKANLVLGVVVLVVSGILSSI